VLAVSRKAGLSNSERLDNSTQGHHVLTNDGCGLQSMFNVASMHKVIIYGLRGSGEAKPITDEKRA